MAGFDDVFRALESIPGGVAGGTRRGLRKGAARVMGRAKSKLGTYQSASSGYPAWPRLKPETVRRKHLSRSGKITRAGKKYIVKHGQWGAGGNDDGPLASSGHLKQAITMDDSVLDSKGVVYVGVAAGSKRGGKGSPGNYAAAHEFGYAPKKIPARPYLRPSLHESKEDIKKDVAKELAEELRRSFR